MQRHLIRRSIKSIAETILGGDGLAPLLRHRTSGTDLILGYHNVVPPGESPVGTQSLHIGFDTFVEQINAAIDGHRIVTLAQIIEENK